VATAAFAQTTEKTSLDDNDIALAIEAQLAQDPGVSANGIDVTVTNGTVHLDGAVSSILSKQRATRIAQTVRGVRSVINQISVPPSGKSDREIRDDVQDALRDDPVTESWEIIATVTDGDVTLSGAVDSWQEKRLAENVVMGVKGVRDVTNRMTINADEKRSDGEIEEEIRKTLRWDLRVDDALLKVAVDGGNVTLTGTVGSAVERIRAEADCWVAGVTAVDTSAVKVELWARDKRLRTDKYVVRSDKQVRQAVLDSFLYDPRVNVFDVVVTVDSGTVTLSGVVSNVKAKRAAARDARDTVGVWRVRNQLKVRPSTPTDSEIAAKIRDALRRDPYVDRYEITVIVVDGHAYLSGEVDSLFERAQADDVTSRVYGVAEIHNNLSVEDPDILTYHPYIDDWDPSDYSWPTRPGRTTRLSDWEIKQQIEDELLWSPFVNRGDITIEVEDGVATLTGTVDTWSERRTATENAYDGGAVVVDNDLTIRFGPEYFNPQR
jgi:osmotically-inducible protein OsmY